MKPLEATIIKNDLSNCLLKSTGHGMLKSTDGLISHPALINLQTIFQKSRPWDVVSLEWQLAVEASQAAKLTKMKRFATIEK